MSALRRVFRITPSDQAWLALTALLAFLTLAAGIGLLATSGYLIARSAVVATTATLAVTITAVRFFAVGRAAFRYGERYVGHATALRIVTTVRASVFRALIPRAVIVTREERAGDVVAQLGADVDEMQDVAVRVMAAPVACGLAIILAALTLGALAPILGLSLAAALVLCGIGIPLGVHLTTRGATRRVVDARAALWASLIETLEGLDELAVNGRRDLITMPADEATLYAAQRRLARAQSVGTMASGLATGATITLLLALAIPLTTAGALPGVWLAAVPLIVLASFEAIPPLADAVERYGGGRAAAQRIDRLTAAPIAVTAPRDPVAVPARGVLTFHAVTFSYPGDPEPVLDRVSFTVAPSETVALCGPSGIGKSTVVALLERAANPRSGTISIGDVDVTTCDPVEVRRHFAFVAQPDHLFDTTLRDNLHLGDPDADDTRLTRACRAVALTLPDGLDTRVGPDGTALSGGERQRVLIARALLADRPVLVLDEATAHLDAETEAEVFNGIRTWRDDQAMLVVTHRVGAVPHVDRIVDLTPAPRTASGR